ncbi:MAG: RluA family pseudouridine synthase, partial [Verrucomicrobia bacterium]|nr:RluA family pseudouridine synthase [Verrucomicrobiota bacterium]
MTEVSEQAAGGASETFTVEQSLPSARFDAFLHQRYPQLSRGALQRMIAESQVRVNGGTVKSSHHPARGEVVVVTWPQARPSVALPEAMSLDVLYEDACLLVLNKPPGLVVHPAAGNPEHTLVNALLHHCAGQLSGIGGVARPGIVHRLDKDTSGCLVVAKTDAAHLALSEQFAERTIRKVYHAIVCGHLPNRQGNIAADIARHPAHRKRMAVLPTGGRAARTSFLMLERLRGATLVEAGLHTGRTHQIRVHFQYIGFPVFGDSTYGKRASQLLAESSGCVVPRQMLHASLLEFVHPLSGQKLTLQALWPADFSKAVETLRAQAGAVGS